MDGIEQDDVAPEVESQSSLYLYWMEELRKAKQREKTYRKEAKKVVDIYEADKADDYPFNILYSNTETIAPALYNTNPRPDVKPKNKKSTDPTVVAAAKLAQRLLEVMLDSGSEDDTTPDSVFKQAVHEALVPGRGLAWGVYEAEIVRDESGQPMSVSSECVCLEELPWDRFLCGYAKKWSKTPWVAAIWYMTKQELVEKFGQEILKDSEFKGMATEGLDGEEEERKVDSDDAKPLLACVYEIWDKSTRTVIYLTDSLPEKILKQEKDPLGLVNFFPCPEPLQFFRRIKCNTPVPLYKFYEDQAEELNDITSRIRRIVQTLRVRGGYDATLQDLVRVLEAKDGQLIPLQNVASLGNGQGANLSNSIWYQPLKEPIIALQQLYAQREQVKGVIYEITGVSDILRGASQASETATAQSIKNQWGTLRLKRAQSTVATFCRDALRIMLEIGVSRLSPQTIMAMTDMQLPEQAKVQEAQMMLRQAQVMGQQPPPEAMQLASSPSIEQVLELLQNDLSRSFRIDIETNSTVDIEATEDKKDFSELLNAISQFLNGVAPLVADGSMPMSAASVILLSIVRRFRMGTEVEDEIIALGKQPPQSQKPDPKAEAEKAKLEGELQKMQVQAQFEEKKMAREEQVAVRELQLREQELAMRERELQMEMEFKMQEHQMKLAALRAQTQAAIVKANAKPSPGEGKRDASL